MMDIHGMRIVVTGGAQGIGRHFAQELASQGARVLSLDTRHSSSKFNEHIQAQNQGEVAELQIDITEENQLDSAAKWVVERWGGLDGLVNNAAIYAGLKRRSFDLIPIEEWDRVMSVNVKGVWLSIRTFAPMLAESSHGVVVNMASEVAFTGSYGFPHYVASKGAVIALTKALARELGTRGIRVNAIAPGFTDTEASRTLADVNKYDVTPTPLGRVAHPEDLLGTLIYLLSDASAFVTGQTILVNGGRIM
ncbi:MAG: SDR family oxidoreductase [Nitrososphaerota archaeon]|jgi:NAD(P)-dependent dehydrogenase (short-subunit alcohol dehydrogenase family)|nr:SDR family oxidoreductase [Nitrososphaerota archaeon]